MSQTPATTKRNYRQSIVETLCHALETGDARLPRPILTATEMERSIFDAVQQESQEAQEAKGARDANALKRAYDTAVQDVLHWLTDPRMRLVRRTRVLQRTQGYTGADVVSAARESMQAKARAAKAWADKKRADEDDKTPYHVAAAAPTDLHDDDDLDDGTETDDYECPRCGGMKRSSAGPASASPPVEGKRRTRTSPSPPLPVLPATPVPMVSTASPAAAAAGVAQTPKAASTTRAVKRDFRCKYKLRQTRKLDEDETKFIKCLNPACGHNWIVY